MAFCKSPEPKGLNMMEETAWLLTLLLYACFGMDIDHLYYNKSVLNLESVLNSHVLRPRGSCVIPDTRSVHAPVLRCRLWCSFSLLHPASAPLYLLSTQTLHQCFSNLSP
jgi:hypothetical protein